MKYRKFGNTDLVVSEVGFGAWAIGGNAMVGNTPIGWGKTDDDISVSAIHKSRESGINFPEASVVFFWASLFFLGFILPRYHIFLFLRKL